MNCIYCRTPLDHHPCPADTCYQCHLDGTPIGSEMAYLSSLFDYCPQCGFVTWTEYGDCLQELDMYNKISMEDRLAILKDDLDETGRRLLLAVCRYGKSAVVWLYLFRYYWMRKDRQGVVQTGNQFLKMQDDLLKRLNNGSLDRNDAKDIVIVADVCRKLGKFDEAIQYLYRIEESRPEGWRVWLSDAVVYPIRRELSLCEAKDDQTDF